MNNSKHLLLISSFALLFVGCGGKTAPTPAQPPASQQPPAGNAAPAQPKPPSKAFKFNAVGPHANPLVFDAADEVPVRAGNPGANLKLGGAGVFVYSRFQGQDLVLIARRGPGPGHNEWGVFGGTVEPKDTDSTGVVCYSRAAEHELYEESVSVYHKTDANALRTRPSHLVTLGKGYTFKTFFSEQKHIPAKVFNDAYLDARKNNRNHAFLENEEFLWVPLADLLASVHANTSKLVVTDAAGAQRTLQLHGAFFRALTDPGYQVKLNNLP